MMERFHKLFLRTLRALQDLRRHSPPVIVQNAGQVNVGSRQVNVAQAADVPSGQKATRGNRRAASRLS